MKLNYIYSYDYNFILNDKMTEKQNLQNFASIISDRDRFEIILNLVNKNKKLLEKKLDTTLKEIDIYIVRAEKFKSFSFPITIEYSILPEEMLLYLLKEIIKSSIEVRFKSELQREEYVNSLVKYILINGDFGNKAIIKFENLLHEESKRLYQDYDFKKVDEIDFSKKSIKQLIEESYE